MMNLTSLQQVLQAVIQTEPEEIGCKECFAELDRFVELMRAGKPAEEIMPLVKEHLERCGDCREEYRALRVALQEIE